LPSWIRSRIRIPDPDPLTRLNPDPIRIRIRNPGGIPIAPSRRMLETLLLDEDSLLLTSSISTVLQVFNAVLCNFLELFFVRFFFTASDYLHSFFSYLLNNISCFSGFSGKLVPWLCHSLTLKLFLLTSVLAYLWTRFSGSAA
jgi:hypothetical protein